MAVTSPVSDVERGSRRLPPEIDERTTRDGGAAAVDASVRVSDRKGKGNRSDDDASVVHRIPALLLFFATGAAGVVYQTVWMRMLVRAFGVTVWATTTVVAVFMAGLALGAFLAARTADRRPSLARWGIIELGVAASAVGATALIAVMPKLWSAWSAWRAASAWSAASDDGTPSNALRVALVALCLIVPTTLMGMTLPILVAA